MGFLDELTAEERAATGRVHRLTKEGVAGIREAMKKLSDLPNEFVLETDTLLSNAEGPGLTAEEKENLDGRILYITNAVRQLPSVSAPSTESKSKEGSEKKTTKEKKGKSEKASRGRRESPRGPEGLKGISSTYLVGEVIEQKLRGKPSIRVLEIRDSAIGDAKFTAQTVPRLAEANVGDLIALELRPDGKAYRFAENLGQRETYKAESARRAYLIGNGRIMPEAVRNVERELEGQGQNLITSEIERLEALVDRNIHGVVHPDDQQFGEKFRHGVSRVDWRNVEDVHIMTIDPETARDHDDALHARRVRGPNGKWCIEVGVHIADSSHFVPIDKNHKWYALFDEARKRGFTLYTPGEAYPMQPKILANDLCSLEEGKERLAFSTVFLLDAGTGEIVENGVWQGKSIIKVKKQHTYETAQKLYDATPSTNEQKIQRIGIRLLQKYADKSRELRKLRKPITFPDRQELEVVTDEFGEESAEVRKHLRTHDLVEAFMVQANDAKANTLLNKTRENPELFFALLRFHEIPPISQLKRLATNFGAHDIAGRIDEYIRAGSPPETDPYKTPFVNEIVYDLLEYAKTVELPGEAQSRKEVRAIVAEKEDHYLRGATETETEANINKRFEKVRNDYREMLRGSVMGLLGPAKYTTDARGHFSLAKGAYTQGTSPIRRFADVVVHHLLNAALAGDPSLLAGFSIEDLRDVADHMNERQRIIRREQQRSQQTWATEHLLKQLQEVGAAIEIRNARIMRVPKDDAEDPFVLVKIKLPNSPFSITMPVPTKDFDNFPEDNRDQEDLRNGTVTVNVTGGSVSNATLKMELVSASDLAIGRREKLDPNIAAQERSFFIAEIADIKATYGDVLKEKEYRTLARELKNIEARVEKMNEYIGGHAMRTLAADIASLKTGLRLESGTPHMRERARETSRPEERPKDAEIDDLLRRYETLMGRL